MRQIPLSDIQDAARAIYDVAVRTPLIRLDIPAAIATSSRVELYLKLETLQPVGSFKIRGAHNAIRQMTPAELQDGVWTVSAGNAAQGVALAARHAGVPCSVMVMDTAPAIKVQAITQLGASIVPASYDECWRTVEAHGSSRMRGRFVHPFDDDRFMAGNATIALEILEDLPDVGTVVAAIGGGGLLAGVGSAFRALRPEVEIVAAEPETATPLATSFSNGRASACEHWQPSFVDGAGGRSVLPTMWPLLSRVVSRSVVVPLKDVSAAMRLVADRCHVIAEGAAGCAVAAALTLSSRAGADAPSRTAEASGTDIPDGPRPEPPLKIVAVVSGGNIDLTKFASLVGACG